MRPSARKKSRTQQQTDTAASCYSLEDYHQMESQVVTALLDLAEKFCAPDCPRIGSRPLPQPAVSERDYQNNRSVETETLVSALKQIQTLLHSDQAFPSLAQCLFDAVQGDFSPYLLCRNLFSRPSRKARSKTKKRPTLSAREVEVLREAGKGHSHDQIAHRLGITRRTVDTHLHHTYRKLEIEKGSPFRAAARAVELGYLEIEAVDIVASQVPGHGRNYLRLATLCSNGGDNHQALEQVGLRPMAELGLLLLMLSNVAARNLSSYPENAKYSGMICEFNREGNLVRRFGTEQIGIARSMAMAPEPAARAGFTPGHLYVAYDCVPPHHLNRGAIAEFTPDGRFIRAFCGGCHVETRLVGPLSLAFAADGALLVTSGLLTDAILRFDQGGRQVQRFAEGLFSQIAVGPAGNIYAAELKAEGSQVVIFDLHGNRVGTIGGVNRNGYEAIAVTTQGQVTVARTEAGGAVIGKPMGRVFDVYEETGQYKATWDIGGVNHGLLSLDAHGRLYVPCARVYELKIVGQNGKVEQWIDLRTTLKPWAACVNETGQIWICGRALEK